MIYCFKKLIEISCLDTYSMIIQTFISYIENSCIFQFKYLYLFEFHDILMKKYLLLKLLLNIIHEKNSFAHILIVFIT